jgi:hypothetical protein
MKLASLVIFTLLVLGNKPVFAQQRKDSVDVTIRFNGAFTGASPVDSVLVVFDRYDHSGAGIVKKVYYPTRNQLIIPRVPAGRYLIGILCLGPYQQLFTETTFVNKRRNNNLVFNLKRCEQYVPGIFVPVDVIDLNRLTITRHSSFKP